MTLIKQNYQTNVCAILSFQLSNFILMSSDPGWYFISRCFQMTFTACISCDSCNRQGLGWSLLHSECVANKSTNLIATVNLTTICPHFQDHNSENFLKPSNFGRTGRKELFRSSTCSYNIVLMLVRHCTHLFFASLFLVTILAIYHVVMLYSVSTLIL